MDLSTVFKTQGDPSRPAKKAKKKSKKVSKPKKRNNKGKVNPKANGHQRNQTSIRPALFHALNGPSFSILPLTLFPDITHLGLRCLPISIREIWLARIQKSKYSTMFTFFPQDYPKVFAQAVTRMHKSRQLFRRFLHRWRASRLRQLNTEDCITLEPIREPIYIVDWSQRTKTAFEAKSLMKDITERLMLNDGFFEDSQMPRNPMTNLPLTQPQIISVWTQLAKSSVAASWAFTAFRKARFDMTTYMLENSPALKLNALRKNMAKMDDYDTQERMMDFIAYVYDQEDVSCPTATYSYCVKWLADTPEMKAWQAVCTKFYETHILYGTQPDRCKLMSNQLIDSCISLINRDKRLIAMKKADWNLHPERRPIAPAAFHATHVVPLASATMTDQLAMLEMNSVPGTNVEFSAAAAQLAEFLTALNANN